jgi:hypothetical protein
LAGAGSSPSSALTQGRAYADSTNLSNPIGQWTQLAEATSPSPRLWEGLAYDVADQEFVLFGGTGPPSSIFGDTWVLRHGVWTNLTSDLRTAPSPRYYPGMAWDPALDAVVLFGGINDPISFSDTWMFVHNHWTNLTGFVGPSPAGRSYAAMSFDSTSGDLLLFGGFNESPFREYGDTWEFRSERWVNLTSSLLVSPPPRPDAAMADDPGDGRVVLFGGDSPNDSVPFYNDTWGFSAGNWTNLSPVLSRAPSGREDPALSSDAGAGFLLLFGGTTTPGTPALRDTWTLSGRVWSNVTTRVLGSPPPAGGAREAYDPSDGTVLLFGGVGVDGFLSETWVFTSTVSPGASPGPSLTLVAIVGVSVGAGALLGGTAFLRYRKFESKRLKDVPPR